MIRLRYSLLTVLALAGCGNDDRDVQTPAGLDCTVTSVAADSDGLSRALASTDTGGCVLLAQTATYVGTFEVRAGVSLAAEAGTRATLRGGSAGFPVVKLNEGAQLVGVDVLEAGGVGVAVYGSKATVRDVKVSGAKSAALAVLCKDGCDAGTVSLTDVVLEKSQLGLWVSGARLSMKGGQSSGHESTSLSSAAGIIGQDGAKLDLDGVTVEKNMGVGVLVDGAATSASIKNATISENAERGVWAQRIAGTIDAPALRIEASQVTKNRIVGVGALESRGIIIVGGRVGDTVAAPLVTNLASTEMVGDGIGLFSGSTDFKLESTALEANARAAGLVDGSERGIIIVGGKIAAGASGLKFVVQNSTGADVQISETDRTMPAKALGVSAPKLALPPVL
ncbi:MAG: right-handed parallel beta-helix repeat-containing protein [Labilithrix sp.]|nr:right-handed parallel beta-helix repeat-containing protein [Labilithrix sp.]